jgi:nicotinamidase/pyrazinamidase
MKTVFFDVDTQLDFLTPAGALAVSGAAAITPALAALTRHALSSGTLIVSTMDAHAENDAEFRCWKPHCVIGTQGQAKLAVSLSPRAVRVPDLSAPQIIVEKHTIDIFLSPQLAHLVDALGADRFVVYGLVTEFCVAFAAFGLLARGAQVQVVTDAIRAIEAAAEQRFYDDFRSRGGKLIGLGEALG